MSRTRTEQSAQMISVYNGRQLAGFVIARGRRGFESFDAGERSLGTFETQAAAVDEIMRVNGGTR
jgi:hypothetical protein